MKKSDSLEGLGDHIDTIDARIVALLAEREKISLKIGREKIRQGKSIVDIALENKRIAMAAETAKKLGMGYFFQRFAENVLHKIIVHCRKKQQLQEMRAKGRK